jgi:hypothetical protein
MENLREWRITEGMMVPKDISAHESRKSDDRSPMTKPQTSKPLTPLESNLRTSVFRLPTQ